MSFIKASNMRHCSKVMSQINTFEQTILLFVKLRFAFIVCSKMYMSFDFTAKEQRARNSTCFWSAQAVESSSTG